MNPSSSGFLPFSGITSSAGFSSLSPSKFSQVESEVEAMPRKRSAKSSGLVTCFSASS